MGNNFKKRLELQAPSVQKQIQQSFNIMDMSNIRGKHVHSVKSWRNHIRAIVFSTKTASVTDFFKIIAITLVNETTCSSLKSHDQFKFIHLWGTLGTAMVQRRTITIMECVWVTHAYENMCLRNTIFHLTHFHVCIKRKVGCHDGKFSRDQYPKVFKHAQLESVDIGKVFFSAPPTLGGSRSPEFHFLMFFTTHSIPSLTPSPEVALHAWICQTRS